MRWSFSHGWQGTESRSHRVWYIDHSNTNSLHTCFLILFRNILGVRIWSCHLNIHWDLRFRVFGMRWHDSSKVMVCRKYPYYAAAVLAAMIANGHTMKTQRNLSNWNEKDWPDPLGQCTSATFWTIHSRATCQRSSWDTMTLLSQVQQMQPLTILTTQAEAVLRIKSFMNLCPQAHFKSKWHTNSRWAWTALQRCITKRRSRMSN